MSWYILDSGNQSADFATNRGLIELLDAKDCPPPLKAFIESQEADDEAASAIVEACDGKPKYDYIARLFRDMVPPIRLHDGTEDDSETEDDEQ